jgi:DNA-binding CsgD family transcriptional regulator/PAS domain-containing protein
VLTLQDTEVLVAISKAGAQGGAWPDLLRALTHYLQADDALLYSAQQVWGVGGLAPESTNLLDSAGLRLGRVYTGEELEERLLFPANLRQASDHRAIGFLTSSGTIWLVVSRTRDKFRAVDGSALAALVPHIAQSIEVAAYLQAVKIENAHASSLLRRLGIGVIRWDHRGRPIACDQVAREIISGLSSDVRLQEPPQHQAIYQIAPNVEILVDTDPKGQKTGFLKICDVCFPSPELVAEALAVSVAEARLACALAQGNTIQEAATRLGLKLSTARFYSKQIFAKTGLRGQPELLRRLFSSALILAPSHVSMSRSLDKRALE